MTSMNVNEKDRWVDINKPDVVVVESTCRCLRNTRRTPDGRGLCSINPLRYNLWSQFKLLAKPNRTAHTDCLDALYGAGKTN